jgi:hypothetical protein
VTALQLEANRLRMRIAVNLPVLPRFSELPSSTTIAEAMATVPRVDGT